MLFICRYKTIVFSFLIIKVRIKQVFILLKHFCQILPVPCLLLVMITAVFAPREAITGFSLGCLYSARSR